MKLSIVLSFLAAAGSLAAQTTNPNSLASLVLSETPALEIAPDLGAWRNAHPGERLKNAAYDNEYETQGLWCAASVADFALPDGVKIIRQAFFYAPPDAPVDPLPDLQHCKLFALWYEVSNPPDAGTLAKLISGEFSQSLGHSEELLLNAKRRDLDWGSGYWNPYLIWEGANRRITLGVDPGGPIPDPRAHKRLLVIARSSSAPRGLSFDWMGDPPKGQPALENAPEADRVAHVEKPCSFDDGRNNWQGGLISFGLQLLRDFPASRWKSYMHLTLARSFASKLSLTYPGIERDGADKPDNPDELRREAIVHFRAFLDENPKSPEASSARKEAWRLLAGLPPTPNHFGCTD